MAEAPCNVWLGAVGAGPLGLREEGAVGAGPLGLREEGAVGAGPLGLREGETGSPGYEEEGWLL